MTKEQHDKLIEQLEANLATVKSQPPERLNGCAVMALPTGEMIETVVLGSDLTAVEFLKHVVGKITEQQLRIQSASSGGSYPVRR